MSKLDLSPEGLVTLVKTASIRFVEIYLRNAETVTFSDLRAIEQAMLPTLQHTLRALATERRNDFLAGALAMREAAVAVCAQYDARSPYIGQAGHAATTIRAIDPASLTEKPAAPVVDDAMRDIPSPHAGVTCYWDAKDRDIGYYGVNDIMEKYGHGEIVEIEHVAIVETTFHASLPAAPDSDSDDDWEFEGNSVEEVEAALTAEQARRAALEAALKGEK